MIGATSNFVHNFAGLFLKIVVFFYLELQIYWHVATILIGLVV